MILLHRLAAQNFKQLQDVTLHFPAQGAILIEGENEAGKSSLFEAVFFALYGQSLIADRDYRLEHLRNYGADELRVELDFSIEGKPFTIARRVGKTHTARLVCPDTRDHPGETITILNEIRRRLAEELRLSPEALLNTCFVEQKRLERLEDMDTRTRRETINELLNLRILTDLEVEFRITREEEESLAWHRERMAVAQLDEEYSQLHQSAQSAYLRFCYLDLWDTVVALRERAEAATSALQARERAGEELHLAHTYEALRNWIEAAERSAEVGGHAARMLEIAAHETRLATSLAASAVQVQASLRRVVTGAVLAGSGVMLGVISFFLHLFVMGAAGSTVLATGLVVGIWGWRQAAAIKMQQGDARRQNAALEGERRGLEARSSTAAGQQENWINREAAARELLESLDKEIPSSLEEGRSRLSEIVVIPVSEAGTIYRETATALDRAVLELELTHREWKSGRIESAPDFSCSLRNRLDEFQQKLCDLPLPRAGMGTGSEPATPDEPGTKPWSEPELVPLAYLTRLQVALEDELPVEFPELRGILYEDAASWKEQYVDSLNAIRNNRTDRRIRADRLGIVGQDRNNPVLAAGPRTPNDPLERVPRGRQATDHLRRAVLGEELLDAADAEASFQSAEKEIEARRRAGEMVAATRKSIVSRVMPLTLQNMRQLLPLLTDGRYQDVEWDEATNTLSIYDNQARSFQRKRVFSGGARDQISLALRLAFALATLPSEHNIRPGWLFLDEPLSSFDRRRTQALVDLLTRGLIRQQFRQILLVSHSESFDPQQFDYRIRMETGHIVSSTLPAPIGSSQTEE